MKDDFMLHRVELSGVSVSQSKTPQGITPCNLTNVHQEVPKMGTTVSLAQGSHQVQQGIKM